MKRYAPAKVNLALDVLDRTPEGYHLLDMIMTPISLWDEIEIVPNEKGRHCIYVSNGQLPAENTITKTLSVFEKAHGLKQTYDISVKKKIPEQAGLAGGSADAACLLHALNDLEKTELSMPQLETMAKEIGADVPFCLHSKTSRVQGIGEKVRELPIDWSMDFLLVKPDFGISTPQCFACYDQMPEKHYDVEIVEDALLSGNIDLLYQTMENALEKPAMEMEPALAALKEKMLESGLVRVLMTGSGSALMGFSVDASILKAAEEALKDECAFCQIVTAGKGVV